MKITDIIKEAQQQKKTVFSIEILPPLKGQKIDAIFSTIESFLDYNVKFINVTYHRHDFLRTTNSDGQTVTVPYRKRPGTISICSAIQNRFNIETVPHLICGGFSKEETEDALIDLKFLGIKNVLALQGDARKGDPKFIPEPGGHHYASELVEQIRNMDKGKYLHLSEEESNAESFCVGVAAYPEKHFAANNFEEDFNFFVQKVRTGADFAATQLFFDNNKFFDFVKKCREHQIDIPILPGIKPISKLRHLEILPKVFFVNFPEALEKELRKAKTDAQVEAIGVEWCIFQCKDLLKNGFDILHFYTMGKGEIVHKIAKEVL